MNSGQTPLLKENVTTCVVIGLAATHQQLTTKSINDMPTSVYASDPAAYVDDDGLSTTKITKLKFYLIVKKNYSFSDLIRNHFDQNESVSNIGIPYSVSNRDLKF